MTFFNTKEEVIDIELTPYGKHLLSEGKWKPAYYEFYDDDILYDSEYAGFSEKQDETKERIKETPRQKVQYSFEGAETRYKRFLKRLKDGDGKEIPVLEQRKNFFLSSLPLGNSAVGSSYYPSVSIKTLNGNISSSVQEQIEQTDSTSPIKVKGLPSSLFQINMETQKYSISLRAKTDNEEQQEENPFYVQRVKEEFVLEQETVELVKNGGYYLFDVTELETSLQKENFDLFIYEIKEDLETGETIEVPLYFKKQQENIVNNIYYETQELGSHNMIINEEYAEFYFDIMTDKEIPNEIMCKHLDAEEVKKLNTLEGYNIACQEMPGKKFNNKDLLLSSKQALDLEEC